MIVHTKKFHLEERRRQVASLLAQSMTEQEIADKLGVDRSTISRDIKTLKLLSQRFVFDLAKSDLAYYYKQCIDGIEEVRRKGREIFTARYLSMLFSPQSLLHLILMISESIIFCCESNNAISSGSVAKGSPLALIAAAYL